MMVGCGRAVIERTTLRHKMGVLMAPYRGSHWFPSFPPPMRHRKESGAKAKKSGDRVDIQNAPFTQDRSAVPN